MKDFYDLADALYNAGYRDARKENDQDARACKQWQDVVDALDTRAINEKLLSVLESIQHYVNIYGTDEEIALVGSTIEKAERP